jgi:hypothetical protein
MFAARWERAHSMKTNNSPSLLFDFQESERLVGEPLWIFFGNQSYFLKTNCVF